MLRNDSDPDGDALSAVLVSGPAHGTLTLNANGSFRYTPAADYNGVDSFSYRASDGQSVSNVATVSLTVQAVNDVPIVSVAAGGSCGSDDLSGTLNLTVADVDNPAAELTLSATSDNQALVPDSKVSFAGTGADRSVTATTVSDGTGTAVLSITVSGGQATGTVEVTVTAAGTSNDTVTGSAWADLVRGQKGHDTLSGGEVTTCCAAGAATTRCRRRRRRHAGRRRRQGHSHRRAGRRPLRRPAGHRHRHRPHPRRGRHPGRHHPLTPPGPTPHTNAPAPHDRERPSRT